MHAQHSNMSGVREGAARLAVHLHVRQATHGVVHGRVVDEHILMLWYWYRQVPGRGDTMLVADSRGYMCLHVRSPYMAQMDPSAADAALAVWNGSVQDARRHAHQ